MGYSPYRARLYNFVFLFFSLFSLSAEYARAESPPCGGALHFIPVKPKGPGRPAECSESIDRLSCLVKKALSHFQPIHPTGNDHEAFMIELDHEDHAVYTDRLMNREQSPAIFEINQDRIFARQIAGISNICEPNYVYLGEEPVLGLGPAFGSSVRFSLNGSETNNFMFLDDQKIRYLPFKALSKDALIDNSYFDITVTHELAHGLMQDLYGVDEFAKIEASTVSKNGHMASFITDPSLAWYEGFAEGYEAYLGKKHLTPEQLRAPDIEHSKNILDTQMKIHEFFAPLGYIVNTAIGIYQAGASFAKMNSLSTQILKVERQKPIWVNEYVLRGAFVNIRHEYGVPPPLAIPIELESVIHWEVESDDAIASKEGVVAHFIYFLLTNGFKQKVFETIIKAKPQNFLQFATELKKNLTPNEWNLIEPLYQSIFDVNGRRLAALNVRIQIRKDMQSTDPETIEIVKILKDRLSKISIEKKFSQLKIRNLWIEFNSDSLLHKMTFGKLDRLNLANAEPSRIKQFLETVNLQPLARKHVIANLPPNTEITYMQPEIDWRTQDTVTQIRETLLTSLLNTREALQSLDHTYKVNTVTQFVQLWKEVNSFKTEVLPFVNVIASSVIEAESCYLSHCQTPF